MGSHRRSWVTSIRSFVLSAAGATLGGIGDKYLVIREQTASPGVPLLMEALPESRMIFLIRAPRCVVSSWLASEKERSWLNQILVQDPRRGRVPADQNPSAMIERRTQRYALNVGSSKQAYEAYAGPKALLKYEDLCAATLGAMKRIYSELEFSAEEKNLVHAVEKLSWEKLLGEERRGQVLSQKRRRRLKGRPYARAGKDR